ncbi:MAG: hypothetical protein FJ296_01920 [Planctomycetes bacterium]|nr:hypothetical protein [Planctomycetota bacterium]
MLGDFGEIANNHYDTDGALSAFAMLHPEQALARAEAMLAAAATGDFCVWHGEAALAVELTVMKLTRAAGSPLAERLRPGMADHERHALGYEWLLANLAGVLDDPFAFRSLWDERHGEIVDDVRRIEAGAGMSVRAFPDLDLALVSSDRPVTGIGLNLAAGDCSRVLLVLPSRAGYRYRFRYRVESWFELVSRKVRPRPPLEPVLQRLERAEGLKPGAAGGPAWWCDSPASPVCEMGFGTRAGDAALFDDPDVSGDPPSRLLPSTVIEALALAWGAAEAAPAR